MQGISRAVNWLLGIGEGGISNATSTSMETNHAHHLTIEPFYYYLPKIGVAVASAVAVAANKRERSSTI